MSTAPSPTDPQVQPKTDVTTLVRDKGQRLNLVDRAGLYQSIDEAVLQAITAHVADLDPGTIELITRTAREGIVERLKSSSKSVRGLPQSAFLRDVMAARKRLLLEREKLHSELTVMRGDLEKKRRDFETKQRDLMRQAREAGNQQDLVLIEQIQAAFDLVEDHSPELVAIREQITAMALGGIQGERQKLLDAKVDAHRKQVEQFERRIAKLNESLELTESELQRIARMKGIDHGVSSIYRTVQGLSDEDGQYQRKKEMLAEIFEANLALRNQLLGGENRAE